MKTETGMFNQHEAVVEGWYWLCRSRDVPRSKVRALRLLGRDLAVYRGEDGRVAALDAYCAHMGAHLAEGHVEGNELRLLGTRGISPEPWAKEVAETACNLAGAA